MVWLLPLLGVSGGLTFVDVLVAGETAGGDIGKGSWRRTSNWFAGRDVPRGRIFCNTVELSGIGLVEGATGIGGRGALGGGCAGGIVAL
jgi:hypothetical protein